MAIPLSLLPWPWLSRAPLSLCRCTCENCCGWCTYAFTSTWLPLGRMAFRCFFVTAGSSSALSESFRMLKPCACGKPAGLIIRWGLGAACSGPCILLPVAAPAFQLPVPVLMGISRTCFLISSEWSSGLPFRVFCPLCLLWHYTNGCKFPSWWFILKLPGLSCCCGHPSTWQAFCLLCSCFRSLAALPLPSVNVDACSVQALSREREREMDSARPTLLPQRLLWG